jgi:hypothetical protein
MAMVSGAAVWRTRSREARSWKSPWRQGRRVVGEDLEDAAAEDVLALGHRGLQIGVAYRDDLQVGCEDQEEAGQRLEESLQYGAAAAQLIFNRPALGDIANGAGNQHAFLGLERAEADLSRELGAILAQPV